MKAIISSLVAIFFIVSFAWAHGIGQSFEEVVGDYIVDVGVSEFELIAGEPLQFDLVLRNKGSAKTAEFTDVWVRITPPDSGVVFAGDIHKPEFGPTVMTYTFPKGGDYELGVSFQNENGTIAETSFSLEVNGSESSSSVSPRDIIVGALVGLIAAGSISWFLRKKQ